MIRRLRDLIVDLDYSTRTVNHAHLRDALYELHDRREADSDGLLDQVTQLKAELLRERTKKCIHLLGYMTDWTVAMEQDREHENYIEKLSPTRQPTDHRMTIDAKFVVPTSMADAMTVAIREKMKDDSYDMTVVNGALQIAEDSDTRRQVWKETASSLEAACARYREALETAAIMAKISEAWETHDVINNALKHDKAGADFLKETRDMREAVNEKKAGIASQMLAKLPDYSNG